MNIDQSRELLYDYARGRLSEQERRGIEEQLLNSEDLRIELEKVTLYYAAIEITDPVPVPDRFLEKVRKRIDLREARSFLNRLLFPLHLKLPIEFAGVAATVALVIFLFIPQLEKKNYSEYGPVIIDELSQVPSTSQDELFGQSVSNSANQESVDMERAGAAKNGISIGNDNQPGSHITQLPKSSIAKALKPSPMQNTGVKKVDGVKSVPTADLLAENVSAPASLPAPAQKLVAENNDKMVVSEHTSTLAPMVQQNEPQKSFSKSEELEYVSKRKSASFESKRMKTRAYAEESDSKEMKSTMEFKAAAVSNTIKAILAKYELKWTVKEFAGHISTCSASGTPAAVASFVCEIEKLPDVTLLKVVPENYSAALDSVSVEFSVKGKVE